MQHIHQIRNISFLADMMNLTGKQKNYWVNSQIIDQIENNRTGFNIIDNKPKNIEK